MSDVLISKEDFINESGLEFTDISSEKFRRYVYPDGQDLVIDQPLFLHVSKSGHRVFNAHGQSFFIPLGWRFIVWEAKEGEPHFVK
jgi:hypothetical protein